LQSLHKSNNKAVCWQEDNRKVVNKMNLCTLCKSRLIILLPPFVVPVSIADGVADVVDLLALCYITTQT
jgi:hypothetical protein